LDNAIAGVVGLPNCSRMKYRSIFIERPKGLSMSGRNVVMFTRLGQTQSVLPTPGFHQGRQD
jgi:hypothetical protein